MTDYATLIRPTNPKNQTRRGYAPAPHKGSKYKEQRSKIPGDTKTRVGVRVIGEVPETESRPQEQWKVEPRPAPNHPAITVAAILFQPGRTVTWRFVVIIVPAILRQFPHVAQHIEQTILILIKTTHRCGM